MRLLLIRHAEPDYERDSLTEKGFREAQLLGNRARNWNAQDIYVSPLGRARRTAEPIEKALGKQAQVLDWLQEFRARIPEKYGTYEGVPWDFAPSFWSGVDSLYDLDRWYQGSPMEKAGNQPSVKEVYLETCNNLDRLLQQYGYTRKGRLYLTEKQEDTTIILVCHMAISFVMLSHLLGIAFVPLVQGMFLAPSSVTVVSTEEVEPGIASFRCQCIGDVRHLHENREPISRMGYFAEIFQN